MSEKLDNLSKQLQQFNLSEDESIVYIKLNQQENLTALNLSRSLKIPRTRIYRTLEKLIEKGLVSENNVNSGAKFSATNPDRFLYLVNSKEKELMLLKLTAPTIVNQLNSIKEKNNTQLKIKNYNGIDGMKQALINSTKSEDKALQIYENDTSNLNLFLTPAIIESFYIETNKKKIKVNKLTNKKENTDEKIKIAPKNETRYIEKEKLLIISMVIIYDNVYCTFDYIDNDIFITEIYDINISKMQKQIFDTLWNLNKNNQK